MSKGLALFAVLFGAAVMAQQPTAIPQEIASEVPNAAPLWISSSVALDREGNLQPGKAGSVAVSILENFDRSRARQQSAAITADPCAGLSLAFPEIEHYRPHATLNDLIVEAREVFSGRITAIETGFFRGVPASMLRVQILRTLRTPGTVHGDAREVLIPFPSATIVAAGRTYCTRAPGRIEPHVGDRLLAFSYLPRAGVDRNVIEVDAGREIVFEQAKAVIPPSELAKDPRLSGDVSLDRLAQLVGEAVSRRGGDVQ